MEKILVLMSTYNGEKYLEQQIFSILKQQNVNINILVRDDGSFDSTKLILEKFQKQGLLTWYAGENKRPAMSFMDLIYHSSGYKYFAFSDQDDFWEEDKLDIAIRNLESLDSEIPKLYYGNPRIVDADLHFMGNKVKQEIMTDFPSILVNSKATGCTMVFNDILHDILCMKKPDYIAMHDAWVHKVCVTCGGKLIYDQDVHILYRQHNNNVIGANVSTFNKYKMHFDSIINRPCVRSKTIKSLVECYGDYMDSEEIKMAMMVAEYKESIISRLKLFFDNTVKTQYKRRNILYKIAVLCGAF